MRNMADCGRILSHQLIRIMVCLCVSLGFPISGAHASTVHETFFEVLCETMDDAHVDYQWNKGLVPLINIADMYGVKLTISLSPQWAEYIVKSPVRLQKIKTAIQNGHEIGIAHYGIEHNPWDFYTNENDPQVISNAGWNPADKKGDMMDLINAVNMVFSTPIVQALPAKQLVMNRSEYDRELTAGVPVTNLTLGTRLSNTWQDQDVVRAPLIQTINGVNYSSLSMGYFTTLSTQTCDDRQKPINLLSDLYFMLKNSPLTKKNTTYKFGVATHPQDFIADRCGQMLTWFQFVAAKVSAGELVSKTVSSILDASTQ
jgi:hypothetical protein